MKKQKLDPEKNSLFKVVVFFAVVLTLIVLSFIVKIGYVIKNSTFDGINNYILSVTESPTRAYLVSFNPRAQSISSILVSGKRNNNTPGRIGGVFINASINFGKEVRIETESPSALLFYVLTHPGLEKNKITAVDVFRLYMFSKSISPNNVSSEKITLPNTQTDIDKLMSQLFNDPVIIDEQKSIEIVNGTGIDGLGKRLERLIENSGGNVIAISNSQTPEKISKIYYYQTTSYTLQKLQQVLSYTIEPMRRREIADIKIIIGTDGIKETIF